MDQEKFAKAIRRLPSEPLESDHFLIRYGLRNPRKGKGLGPDGVADSVLARSYRNSLERLYMTITQPPWNRPAPQVGSYGKTIVYICDIDHPFTGQFAT